MAQCNCDACQAHWAGKKRPTLTGLPSWWNGFGSITKQPAPKKGKIKVLDHVLADLTQRAETGKEKYGTYLETDNGRDALQDAYEEMMDAAMYLKQALLEKKKNEERVVRLLNAILEVTSDGRQKYDEYIEGREPAAGEYNLFDEAINVIKFLKKCEPDEHRLTPAEIACVDIFETLVGGSGHTVINNAWAIGKKLAEREEK